MKYLGMLYNLNANVHNKIVWWAYGMLITFIHALLFRLANKIIKTNKFSFPVCQTRGQLLFSFTRLGFVCEWYFNFLKSAPLTISRVSETSVLAQISPRKIFSENTHLWPGFALGQILSCFPCQIMLGARALAICATILFKYFGLKYCHCLKIVI